MSLLGLKEPPLNPNLLKLFRFRVFRAPAADACRRRILGLEMDLRFMQGLIEF